MLSLREREKKKSFSGEKAKLRSSIDKSLEDQHANDADDDLERYEGDERVKLELWARGGGGWREVVRDAGWVIIHIIIQGGVGVVLEEKKT